MPVHRHQHARQGSVYAFRGELDAWAKGRQDNHEDDPPPAAAPDTLAPEAPGALGPAPAPPPSRRWRWVAVTALVAMAAALATWQFVSQDRSLTSVLENARFLELTDFPGTEQAAALSRDGRFVAFLSDRAGRTDVWVTQVGTGQFYNLTRDAPRELVNSSIRTLGFSPDGTLVTFWARGANQSDISIWAAPVLGGPPRPYLNGVAEFDWSRDGAGLVYHTPGPGDPMFVRDDGKPEPRKIFSAPPGLHAHFPFWSPDRAFIYFVQGVVPDRMDIWRIRPTGGNPERITTHDSRVSHPVFLDARTLLYLATDASGGGPWIHSIDIERRAARRVGFGMERYTSLSASSDGDRVVATVASEKGALWRLPIEGLHADSAAARQIPLTTGAGSSPRFGDGYLLYVSSKGDSDSIWKLQGEVATELWSAPGERMVGGPAIARDGRHIAFATRKDRRTSLYVVNADGSNARAVTTALNVQGAPAWTPGGESITVAAVVDGAPRLFTVPLDGRSPVPFVKEHSTDPAWSPDGALAVYSGPDIGTTFPVRAVVADGTPYAVPALVLSRGARHLCFVPGTRTLVVLRGEIGHKNLWLIDLATGAERPLTTFAADFNVRDFDISPDGREIVLEQVQEHSDIVLIEIGRR